MLNAFANHFADATAVNNITTLANSPAVQSASGTTQEAFFNALDHHANDSLFNHGLIALANNKTFANLGQTGQGQPQVNLIGQLDRIVSGEAYQGSNGLFGAPVGGAEKLEIIGGFDKIVTAGADPATLTAYEKLLSNDKFKSLNSDTRIALVSQVENYPNARSIANLERLSGCSWFRSDTLDNQQRSAKVVAFASQDPNADRTIIDNTLSRMFAGNIDVQWGPIPATYGWRSKNTFMGLWETSGSTIKFNSNFVPAGNAALPTGGPAQHVAEHTSTHEVNHDANDDRNTATYRYFMGEYRAWYAGETAQNGHPPSQFECNARAKFLVSSTTGGYGRLGTAFNDTSSSESKQIVAFMAKIRGENPATATTRTVVGPSSALSTTAPGIPPEKADANDPNNLDNH